MPCKIEKVINPRKPSRELWKLKYFHKNGGIQMEEFEIKLGKIDDEEEDDDLDDEDEDDDDEDLEEDEEW